MACVENADLCFLRGQLAFVWLALTESAKAGRRKQDPLTHKPFVYRPKSNSAYELCATFATDNRHQEPGEAEDAWRHPKATSASHSTPLNPSPKPSLLLILAHAIEKRIHHPPGARYIAPSCYSSPLPAFSRRGMACRARLWCYSSIFSLWSLRLCVRILSSFLFTRRILIPHHLEPTCAPLSHSSSS